MTIHSEWGDTVGVGFIPTLTPQKIQKTCGMGVGMITVKGVRAGINPALTVDGINTSSGEGT